jgi:hypothetical protein
MSQLNHTESFCSWIKYCIKQKIIEKLNDFYQGFYSSYFFIYNNIILIFKDSFFFRRKSVYKN